MFYEDLPGQPVISAVMDQKKPRNMVAETVSKIERLLGEVVSLQKPFTTRICARCKSPCCLRVHYLYSEKDIFFLKLSGRKPTWRRKAFSKNGCWFLGEAGCTLEPASRPFLCHTYLCEDLRTAIGEEDPNILDALENRFRSLDKMRSQLWSDYLDQRR